MEKFMTVEDLINVCVNLSVSTSYTCKDNEHDLTHAVLELQICLQEMGKRKRNEVNKILSNLNNS